MKKLYPYRITIEYGEFEEENDGTDLPTLNGINPKKVIFCGHSAFISTIQQAEGDKKLFSLYTGYEDGSMAGPTGILVWFNNTLKMIYPSIENPISKGIFYGLITFMDVQLTVLFRDKFKPLDPMTDN
jgi:hypothetical protein